MGALALQGARGKNSQTGEGERESERVVLRPHFRQLTTATSRLMVSYGCL